MGDFLGYVRVRVDRNKPLAESVSVHLDPYAYKDEPSGSLGKLYLYGEEFFLTPSLSTFGLPVGECLIAEKGK